MRREHIPINDELTERLGLFVQVALLVSRLHPAEAAGVLIPILEDLTTPLVQLLWQDYLAAGLPYGGNEDGMWQWAKEQTTEA